MALNELQLKLDGLDNKILLKIEQINEKYKTEVARINEISQLNEELHKNGLNEYRGTLLETLQTKLAEEMEKFNKEKKILVNYLVYYRKSYKLLESICNCNSYKFKHVLDFYKLFIKYKSFLLTKKEIKLNFELLRQPNISFDFLNLTADKIFVYLFERLNEPFKYKHHKFAIVNTNGSLLHERDFDDAISHRNNYIRSNNANIIILYGSIHSSVLIQVFDFKLNLIYAHNLNEFIFNNFRIKNDEIAFYSTVNTATKEQQEIRFFNLANLKEYKLSLQNKDETKPFYIYESKYEGFGNKKLSSELCHFNRDKLYIARYNHEISLYDLIYIVNRKDGSTLIDIKVEFKITIFSIKFDFKSQLYFLNLNLDMIKIYDSNGGLVQKFDLGSVFETHSKKVNMGYVWTKLKFSKDRVIFNIKNTKFSIEYDAY